MAALLRRLKEPNIASSTLPSQSSTFPLALSPFPKPTYKGKSYIYYEGVIYPPLPLKCWPIKRLAGEIMPSLRKAVAVVQVTCSWVLLSRTPLGHVLGHYPAT